MICVLHNKVKQMKVSLGFLHALVCTRWLLISVNNPLECWAARGFPPIPGRDAGGRKESILPLVHDRNPKITFAGRKPAQESELKGFFLFKSLDLWYFFRRWWITVLIPFSWHCRVRRDMTYFSQKLAPWLSCPPCLESISAKCSWMEKED